MNVFVFISICLFFSAGVVLTVAMSIIMSNKKKSDYKETVGVIIDFVYERASSLDDYNVKVKFPFVSYNVNGVEYKVKGNYSKKSWSINDKVKIWYNEKYPNEMTMLLESRAPKILLFVFVLLSIIATFLTIIGIFI